MNNEAQKYWILDEKEEALRMCEDLIHRGVPFELHSPYHVAMKEERNPSRVPLWCLFGGVFGFLFMFILVLLSTYDYVHNVAGQPSFHPPYFLLAYVGLIFCATIACFSAFLYEGGLIYYDTERGGDQLFYHLLEGKFIVELLDSESAE